MIDLTCDYDKWVNDFPYYDDDYQECERCHHEFDAKVFVALDSNKCHHCMNYEGNICDERFVELMRMSGEAA